jgi:hypothetical protein
LTALDADNVTSGTLAVERGGTGAATHTTNKILVGDGSNAVLSPSDLHWDVTNSYLGIGTVVPTHKLHTVGDALIAGTLSATGSVDVGGQVLCQASDTVAVPGYSWTGDADTGMFRPNSNVVAFTTGGSERFRVDDVGNVGVGVSAPTSRLHVAGDVRLEDGDLLGANNMYTRADVDGIIDDVEDNLADGLFWDAETNRLGVGTVEPVATLDVSGDARVTGSVDCDTLFAAQRLSVFDSVGVPYLTGDSGGGGFLDFRNAQDDELLLRLSDGIGLESYRNVEVTGDVVISGNLAKGSGTFNIEHPLVEKRDTHRLVHSFIEGPSADLMYSGMIFLGEGGVAKVNIDNVSKMTPGTFEALTVNRRRLTRNESGFTDVVSSLVGAELVVTAKDPNCRDEILWMVVAERNDDNIKSSSITDDEGRLIVEPEIATR